ncbi:unnamed protein product [Cochlearia groenlandica]
MAIEDTPKPEETNPKITENLIDRFHEEGDYVSAEEGEIVVDGGDESIKSAVTSVGEFVDVLVSIGKQWKELLDYNNSIGFIIHEDAKKLDRNAKNAYTA